MFVSLQTEAQEQIFKAGIIFGMNASQLDGDRSAGYFKLGLVAGLNGVVLLSERIEINIEMLYSERGSRNTFNDDNSTIPFKISTNFIEIPVIFNFKDWLDEDGYYKLYFHTGIAYARLINAKVEDESPVSNLSQAVDDFNKNDLSFLFGVTFYTGPHLAFTFRWSRSFGALYFNDILNAPVPSLQNHTISLRTLYMF